MLTFRTTESRQSEKRSSLATKLIIWYTYSRECSWPAQCGYSPFTLATTVGGENVQTLQKHESLITARPLFRLSPFVTVLWLRFLLYSDWGFSYPDWGFSVFFLSCKANARVKHAKTMQRPPPHSSTLVIFVVLYIVCKCVLPPGDNPIAVNK
jgi:hypothetical protein